MYVICCSKGRDNQVKLKFGPPSKSRKRILFRVQLKCLLLSDSDINDIFLQKRVWSQCMESPTRMRPGASAGLSWTSGIGRYCPAGGPWARDQRCRPRDPPRARASCHSGTTTRPPRSRSAKNDANQSKCSIPQSTGDCLSWCLEV